VPHEHHAGRERHEHHLVRVPGDRACAVNPRDARPVRGREQRRRAVRAVDVQPQPALLAEAPDGLDVVERPGGRRAGRRDHRHHLAAGGAQAIEHTGERLHVHAVVARGHDNGVVRAEAEFSDRARHAIVRVFTADQTGGSAPTPACHASGLAAWRAASSPANVASVPPEVNVPPLSGPNPARQHIHRTTCVSMIVPTGDISKTAPDWLRRRSAPRSRRRQEGARIPGAPSIAGAPGGCSPGGPRSSTDRVRHGADGPTPATVPRTGPPGRQGSGPSTHALVPYRCPRGTQRPVG